MIYEKLTEGDMIALAHERVSFLETQHFRLRLQLADATTDGERNDLRVQLADIERRHAVHTTTTPEQAAPDGKGGDEPDAEGGKHEHPDEPISAADLAATAEAETTDRAAAEATNGAHV